MNDVPRKRASTFFLKSVIVLIGSIVLAISAFSFPFIWKGGTQELSAYTYVLYPGIFGIYATIVPFLFALFQAFMLLRYIDANRAFSVSSIKALRTIKYCAVAMSVLYMTALPIAFVIAELDDAPGLVIYATAFACSPFIIATFAAVLQKLVQQAIDLQSENDLTI